MATKNAVYTIWTQLLQDRLYFVIQWNMTKNFGYRTLEVLVFVTPKGAYRLT